MPRVSTGPKVRLNLDVSVAFRERLERVRVAAEADTMTEVLRRALIAYEALLENKDRIFFIKEDGTKVKVILS